MLIPKVGVPSDVYMVDALLSQIEDSKKLPHKIGIEVLIETALGMANVEAIAQSSKRLEAMHFGVADYAARVRARTTNIGGLNPDYPGDQWNFGISRMVVACRAYGLRAISGAVGAFKDPDGFKFAGRRAAARGCEGKCGVHHTKTALEHEMVAAGGIRDLRNAIGATNRMVTEFAAVAEEQSRQLTATMTSLRRAAGAIDPAKVDSTVKNFRTASANLAEISSQLKETSGKLDVIVAKVDSGNGSAAQLLNDPGMYNDVRQLLQRMDSLVADIKKNPKRYINVKVF